MERKALIYFSLLIVVFIGLIGFIFLISANSMVGGNDSPYIVEISVEKGWNIIAGIIPSEAILSDSEIKESNIEAVWYYAPTLKKYLQIHPNRDNLLGTIDDDVALSSAMWVYSDKAGILKYSTIEDYPPLYQRGLSNGWNFFTITPDIEGKTPKDIKGTCNFEKIYVWDPLIKNWTVFPLDEDFYQDAVGVGLVIKVSSDCIFGIKIDDDGAVVPPPPIPN